MRPKKDQNHSQISAAFKRHGFAVADTSAAGGFVDIVVSRFAVTDHLVFGGETAVIEIKRLEGRGATLKQLEFLSGWLGLCGIVYDIAQISRNFATFCLSKEQKGILMQFCVRERAAGAESGKEYRLKPILRMINKSGEPGSL